MKGHEKSAQAAVLDWLPVIIKALKGTLSIGSAATVGSMMLLTFADVIGRYVFNSPIMGAYEITEILMGLMIFGGLPLVSRARGHITVDFLAAALPPRLRAVQTVFLDLMCSLIAGVLAWRTCLYAGRMVQAGETTLELKISWSLISYVISFLLAITALVWECPLHLPCSYPAASASPPSLAHRQLSAWWVSFLSR